mgnify:CR=1 FL=1
MVEHIATVHDWTFERSTPDELTLTVSGTWCDYHISLTWRDDLEALHLACAFDFKVAKPRLGEIYRLMALINEQLWLGHFDLWKDDGLMLYRHGLLLAGAGTMLAIVALLWMRHAPGEVPALPAEVVDLLKDTA